MSYKTDPELGKAVEEHLKKLGLNTPTAHFHGIQTQERYDRTLDAVTLLLQYSGFDLNDDSMKDTPARVTDLYLNEIFAGLDVKNFPKCTVIENSMTYDQVLCVDRISVISRCEHHLELIKGYAAVAYIPHKKVIGLSKLARIVKYFSRRPQVQERLTQQIGESIKYICDTSNVAVFIKAEHNCMIARGVEEHEAKTSSSFLSGRFKDDPSTRKEFFDLVKF